MGKWLALAAAFVAGVTLSLLVLVADSATTTLAAIGLLLYLPFGTRWRVWAVLAAATLPFAASATVHGAGQALGVCDVFLALALLGYWLSPERRATPLGIRTPVLLVGAYLIVGLSMTVLAHPTLSAGVTLVQRGELTAGWLVLGSIVSREAATRLVLGGFVLSSIVLALAWYTAPGANAVLGVQKNPAGAVLSIAILVVLLAGRSTWRLLPTAVLAGGLACSGSRGSMVGLAAGLIVVLALSRSVKTTALVVGGILAGTYVGLQVIPQSVLDRIVNRSLEGQYNVQLRHLFVEDALIQWRPHRWLGIGVGQYKQHLQLLQTVRTDDPHNVYVLSLTEGGYLLLAAFVVMAGGTLVWLVRNHARSSPPVLLASATLACTLVHAYIDVFWVRGTPSIAWLVVGLAAPTVFADRRPAQEGDQAAAAAKDRRTQLEMTSP